MCNLDIINSCKKFINKIDETHKIKFAYLFGSTSRNEQRKESDIDIAIYFEKDFSDINDAFIRGSLIDMGNTFFNKPVDIVNLKKASLSLKYQIIHDGIVIKDNYKRSSFESLSLRKYFDFKYYSDIYDKAMIERLKNGTYLEGEN